MNCDRIEELLAAYADGEIAADDKGLVEAHVGQCQSCRESLAFFVNLEDHLIARRELRPSAALAAGRIMRRVGMKPRKGWLAALDGVPGAIAAALVAFGVVWLLGGRAISALAGSDAGAEIGMRFDILLTRWLREVNSLAAASDLTLPIVTAGLTALILLVGAWMVFRFVRD